jgi:hypothetical protein
MPKKISPIFTLKIDYDQLLREHFNLPEEEEISTSLDFLGGEIPNKTNFDDRCRIFLSPYKEEIKYWVNMVCVNTGNALPQLTTLPCKYCGGKILKSPIGCPLKYHPESDSSTFNIGKARFEQYLEKANLPKDRGTDWFETEHVFCSFSHVKEHILDKMSQGKRSYDHSLILLTLLMYRIFGKVIQVPTMGTKDVLLVNGGFMYYQEYWENLGKLEFRKTINYQRPLMYSTDHYIQEKKI